MSTNTIPPEEIRAQVADLPVDLYEGDATAYARFDQAFSLESVAIALGESDCLYDEATFPGVVYQPDDLPTTVVVSGDGTVLSIDATEETHARSAVSNVIDTLDDLGLIVDAHTPEISTNVRTVPFSLTPPSVETLGYDDDS
ncbi:hypothetical protein [Halorubrum sp. 48-1-W]|uniref:hypothetical protein n=1 Tax=Halorubrum sp. 48-1-W TaxID=2249761 RepID=UPI0013009D89|nr:hypothetical protein [Halorubrum sp. 48-1-W]